MRANEPTNRPATINASHPSGPLRCGCTAALQTRPVTAKEELVLIHRLPGSGKSTMAKVLAQVGYGHFEAEMYFMVDGAYRYDATRVREARTWYLEMTRKALTRGRRAVVSNTFTRLLELQPYRAMTANFRIIEARGRWQKVHGVPAERLQQMAERWEALPD